MGNEVGNGMGKCGGRKWEYNSLVWGKPKTKIGEMKW